MERPQRPQPSDTEFTLLVAIPLPSDREPDIDADRDLQTDLHWMLGGIASAVTGVAPVYDEEAADGYSVNSDPTKGPEEWFRVGLDLGRPLTDGQKELLMLAFRSGVRSSCGLLDWDPEPRVELERTPESQ